MSILDTILAAERAASDTVSQARASASAGQTDHALALVEKSKAITDATENLRAALGTGDSSAVAAAEAQLQQLVGYAKVGGAVLAGLGLLGLILYLRSRPKRRRRRR